MTDNGRLNKSGRVIVYAPECPLAWRNGDMPRARYVVWAAGIEILPGHVVHHKDENKANDDLDNLEVIPGKLHRRMHMLGNKYGVGNHSRLGKKHTEETRRLYSEQRRGVAKSESHRAAIAAAHLGKPKTCSLCGQRGNLNTHPNHVPGRLRADPTN